MPKLFVPGWGAYHKRQKSLLAAHIDRYKRDVLASAEWWRSLDGHAFEHELARLLRGHGFDARVTRASGDGGVDIIAHDANGSIAVQCKRYAKPVGPAVIRELYGAVKAGGYSLGILAVTGGVTKGVREFVDGKPLRILELGNIVAMQMELNNQADQGVDNAIHAGVVDESLRP